jgi:putative FmdB family regulatory protein
MPIYEFQCDRCSHVFDRLQRLSDPDPDICPECGAPAIRRRLTAPAFRLSGSGWYETDFKKDGDKKRNLTEKGDSPTAGPMPESKSDATSASKSEPRSPASSDAAVLAKSTPKPDPKPASTPISRPASE